MQACMQYFKKSLIHTVLIIQNQNLNAPIFHIHGTIHRLIKHCQKKINNCNNDKHRETSIAVIVAQKLEKHL